MNLSRKMMVVYMVMLLAAVAVIAWALYHALSSPTPGTAKAYLAQADDMAFNNNWIGAAPVYRRAELGLRAKGDLQRALICRGEPNSGRDGIAPIARFNCGN
jgi:hypothetical protein